MIFLACAGAIIASLYMLLTQGLTVLNARRTGVLVSKSYGKAKIERAVETERFEKLLQGRVKALGMPALILVSAICVLAWQIFAMMIALRAP
ncbi:hypothetical protein ASD21_02100 [Caulobacter sp. Root1455]|uniref:hypothetical protein n=1 Tax=unclassified Caulobacter TaxID=2648921 RepID=UPI0006F9FDDB|nr:MULTISPECIES: hypothetical protein [unclassified Caulobacter]KQY35588.1 hypothetical protein ASD38_03255 [Caulobacter sp. Root487D2Y]KQZ06446.1 hypothetical protein ASD21_02100 [Caulobacter sp. Root1455]